MFRRRAGDRFEPEVMGKALRVIFLTRSGSHGIWTPPHQVIATVGSQPIKHDSPPVPRFDEGLELAAAVAVDKLQLHFGQAHVAAEAEPDGQSTVGTRSSQRKRNAPSVCFGGVVDVQPAG